jgi:hypothetical protein
VKTRHAKAAAKKGKTAPPAVTPAQADPMEQAKARMQAKAKKLGIKPPAPEKVNGDLLKAEADAEAAARVKQAQEASRLLNATLLNATILDLRSSRKKSGLRAPTMEDGRALASGIPSPGKDSKAATAGRRTIRQLIIGLLTGNPDATNDGMIAAVRKDFPSSAFDKRHAAWYRSQARTGKLTGLPMTGRK